MASNNKSNNNKREPGSNVVTRNSSPARNVSKTATRASSSPSTRPAPDPVKAAGRPYTGQVAARPSMRESGSMGSDSHQNGDSAERRAPRATTPTTTTPPKAPDPVKRSARVSRLKIEAPRAKPATVKTVATKATSTKSTSPASSAKPRDTNKMTCKARPDNNKPDPRKGGGGGGSFKRFIPWCK